MYQFKRTIHKLIKSARIFFKNFLKEEKNRKKEWMEKKRKKEKEVTPETNMTKQILKMYEQVMGFHFCFASLAKDCHYQDGTVHMTFKLSMFSPSNH